MWLTAERRQAIQLFVTIVATMLVSAGTIGEDSVQHILVIAAAVLQAVAGIISLLNLSFAGAVSWFLTAGRAAVYGLATVVAPAAAGLGLITDAQSVTLLTWVSLGLTALAAFVAIFYTTPVATEEDLAKVENIANDTRRKAADAEIAAEQALENTKNKN